MNYNYYMHYIKETNPEVLQERMAKALSYARGGQCDGAHHKAWSIDQIVRALLGCEEVTHEARMYNGQGYIRTEQAASRDYVEFIDEFEEPDPETGEKVYEWELGVE